jgi:hypothetical protein
MSGEKIKKRGYLAGNLSRIACGGATSKAACRPVNVPSRAQSTSLEMPVFARNVASVIV